MVDYLYQNYFSTCEVPALKGKSAKAIEQIKRLAKGNKAPDLIMPDTDGKYFWLSQFKPRKYVVLFFWASWCPDCQQELPLVNKFLDSAKKYGDINFILVNKLDHEKETKEKALQYLSGAGILFGTYYDDGLTAYNELGLHNIPTTLFLDEQGIIRAWCPRQITEVSVFEGYLKNTVEGSGKVTCDFVTGNMMDDKGGVHTVYDTSG